MTREKLYIKLYLLFASAGEANAFIKGWRSISLLPSNITEVTANHFEEVAEVMADLSLGHEDIPKDVPFRNTSESLRIFCGVQRVALAEQELGLCPAMKVAA